MPQLDPEEPLVRWAVFGKKVEQFLQSDIGDFLLKKSQREVQEAVEALKVVDPTDIEGVRKLQNAVKLAESFQSWLGDAVAAGLQSIAQLEEEHAGT